ncbi:RNA polymerase sigma factor SigI [Peribacillus asahii]|uniref:RNA polymerase sigma factor SigI n=1 Tax=Peribacillus asahii TaxID=228899 RepID=UPI00207A57AA|nr:RNA polymerase sigma factor SigI [Peribacillus asahii]USK61009.1 RNA polymerase sigma factor SigI [Peribacillus asahii]
MIGFLFTALKKKRSLEDCVIKIQQGDTKLRNDTIDSYKPFIAKTVSSVCNRYIHESDDEYSIGLIAFNEAIDKYSCEKGKSLLAFAEVIIKRRVIDYLRSQSRNKEVILESAWNEEGGDDSFLDDQNSIQAFEQEQETLKRRDEILLYDRRLQEFGLSFQELVHHSPKHIDARLGAISIAKTLMDDGELRELLFMKKRLPIKQLEEKVRVSRKTIERHRKYIIAMCIILNEEFVYLSHYIEGVTQQ